MSSTVLNSTFQKIFPIVGLLGVLDTLYLINIYNNPSVCGTNEGILPWPIDCGSVAESQYSTFLGIPLAIIGLGYYLTIILVFLFRDDLANLPIKPMDLLGLILVFGFLISLVLVYLQLFVIGAICLYCMGSVLTTIILGSLYYVYVFKN